MYAVTFAISAGVRMRFGILGCEVVRKTRMAVAVIPGVLAMSRMPARCRSFSACSAVARPYGRLCRPRVRRRAQP